MHLNAAQWVLLILQFVIVILLMMQNVFKWLEYHESRKTSRATTDLLTLNQMLAEEAREKMQRIPQEVRAAAIEAAVVNSSPTPVQTSWSPLTAF
jgi:choline-glycine betaine transporter